MSGMISYLEGIVTARTRERDAALADLAECEWRNGNLGDLAASLGRERNAIEHERDAAYATAFAAGYARARTDAVCACEARSDAPGESASYSLGCRDCATVVSTLPTPSAEEGPKP